MEFYSTRQIAKFYLVDYLQGTGGFYTDEYIANQILFLLSVVHHGLDTPRFYEAISQKSFHRLAASNEARQFKLNDIYGSIYENYPSIKAALERASDSIMFI